jgi:hypothetical protein
MLRNNRIQFSSPSNFNDPFDCRRVYDIRNSRKDVVLRKAAYLARKGASIAEAVVQAEEEIPSLAHEVEHWQEKQLKERSHQIANTGILCLTEKFDNQIMWTFYANKHSGVCIEFSVRDEHEDSQIEFIASAQPIEYSDRCPLINLVQDDPAEIVRKTVLTKATPFSYEAEWRIVRYDDGPGSKPIPKGIITAIIFGANIDQSDRKSIIQACADYDGSVEIVQAQLDPHSYGLRFELDQIV